MAKKASGNWEIFNIIYRAPKFGAEGEFVDKDSNMMVSTQGGREDAKACCEHMHRGCKIVAVLTQTEWLANQDGGCVVKKIEASKKKK